MESVLHYIHVFVVTEGGQGGSARDGDSVLRQRRHPGVEDVMRGGKEEGEKEGARGTHKDPLTWFGILVPEHLRKCQQDFIKGTDRLYIAPSVVAPTPHTNEYGLVGIDSCAVTSCCGPALM